LIIREIAAYILERHHHALRASVDAIAGQLDDVIPMGDPLTGRVLSVFDHLASVLKSLTGIPLQITAVLPASAGIDFV